MERFFNTAGPIKAELHYHIPSFQRIDWEEMQALITSQKYFLPYAPRQTGKTSALLDMMRVHGVISALLSGEQTELLVPHDDLQYVEDLGLIVRKPQIRIANRIYQEVIPRELTAVTQDTMVQQQAWYLTPDHSLDTVKLLTAFQQFFRENSESWIERFDYKEAGPQLLMQAFLQRIINGGGRINREYGLGCRRADLLIEWPVDESQGFHGEVQRIVIELKLQHGALETVIQQGLEQTTEYADKVGAAEAHLVLFNRDPATAWEDRIWRKRTDYCSRRMEVWGA